MQAFDASSMIYAWDNYPIEQFPPLWDWIGGQIEEELLVMLDVAFDEVHHKTPDCSSWLKDNNLQHLQTSNDILQEAKRIKGLLDIVDDKYHPDGVGENDILIIAASRVHAKELVSDEARQPILPMTSSRRKNPSCVCYELNRGNMFKFCSILKSIWQNISVIINY